MLVFPKQHGIGCRSFQFLNSLKAFFRHRAYKMKRKYLPRFRRIRFVHKTEDRSLWPFVRIPFDEGVEKLKRCRVSQTIAFLTKNCRSFGQLKRPESLVAVTRFVVHFIPRYCDQWHPRTKSFIRFCLSLYAVLCFRGARKISLAETLSTFREKANCPRSFLSNDCIFFRRDDYAEINYKNNWTLIFTVQRFLRYISRYTLSTNHRRLERSKSLTEEKKKIRHLHFALYLQKLTIATY